MPLPDAPPLPLPPYLREWLNRALCCWQLSPSNIPDGSITSAMLADDAVTPARLQDTGQFQVGGLNIGSTGMLLGIESDQSLVLNTGVVTVTGATWLTANTVIIPFYRTSLAPDDGITVTNRVDGTGFDIVGYASSEVGYIAFIYA